MDKTAEKVDQFYAAFHLSLYYESCNDEELAKQFMMLTALDTEYARILGRGDPMIDVANVAVQRLTFNKATPASTTSPTKSPTKSPDNASLRKTCNELSVLTRNACKDVPVNCEDGYERGKRASGVTCELACAGQCCRGDSPCQGFTGLVHRDDSCIGNLACAYATIGEVKGPSCTGDSSCYDLKSSRVTENCNGDYACNRAKVGLIEGGCNGSTPCNGEITDSIVDGKLLREETCNGEFSCTRYLTLGLQGIIATSVVDGTIYYPPQDPQVVCEDDCRSAYYAAGILGIDCVGGVPGNGRDECNDNEFAAYPNCCTLRTCSVECLARTLPPTSSPTDSSTTTSPTVDDFWNDNRRSCVNCGGGLARYPAG